MPRLAREEGPIHVFTGQFSGAIWHPPCYAYDKKQYELISRRKMFSKFEAVSRGIDVLKPRMFLGSAGPACFLDPELLHINFQPVNIFPRAGRFFSYVQKRLKNTATELCEPMPGDVLDVETFQWVHKVEERVTDENFEAYVRAYAERMAHVYDARHRNLAQQEMEAILVRLACELQRKLDNLALNDRVSVPLYVGLEELPHVFLRVDFPRRRVEPVAGIDEDRRYTMVTRAADIGRVLDGHLNWEDFLLSLRLKMSRNPDDYDAILHGFLAIEAPDLPAFCNAVLEAESRKERMTVQAAPGKCFSINRYCPHQGADLAEAWIEGGRFLVCPRHRWQFDLENGGKCTMNATTVHALPVVGDGARPTGDRPAEPDLPAAS
jgi:UDP-MurNAc hydroxylase